ncbi:MAG TPA: DNA mismatch repair protein [Planctomycetaceae bacterium]|nr:DNA mismatch repair protein [Planctomycetaceae bacterium]
MWEPKTEEIQAAARSTENEAAGDPVAVADDLDVFGRGSLFQLVSMASLGPGLRRLASWLIGPACRQSATRRHQAATVLAPMRQWRIDFYCDARRSATGTADPDHFLRWITSPSWLNRHKALSLWSTVSPIVFIGLIVALVVCIGMPQNTEAAFIWVVGAIAAVCGINLAISTFMLGEVHDIFASAVSGRGDVDGYQHMFELALTLPDTGDDDLLGHIRNVLSDPVTGATVAMKSLRRIAWAASIKQSGGWFLVYLVLQMGGLWDLHVLRRLERWQAEHASQAARWFDSLGDLEAVASLAAMIDENPTWTTPEWVRPDSVTSPRTVSALQIGHPLLKDGARVCNDVAIGPQGTLLLVTGSNMSGKSTLLRSVGLNVLLAGAGGPVCAKAFSLPDIELATSIRVRDNLDEGVSFYMAELKSLARVVRHAEAIDARRTAGGSAMNTTLLYLLDEILQGTNSRERQIAVAHVLRHLIDRGAIGAISTHDLELADDPQLQSIAHTVHFRETITRDAEGRDQMTFDYQMRQGVSPTTNALRLLEVVGLGKPK